MSKSASYKGRNRIDLLLQGAAESRDVRRLDRGPARMMRLPACSTGPKSPWHGRRSCRCRRADGKHHVVLLDARGNGVDWAFGLDGAASKGTLASGFRESAQSGIRIATLRATCCRGRRSRTGGRTSADARNRRTTVQHGLRHGRASSSMRSERRSILMSAVFKHVRFHRGANRVSMSG